MRAPPRSRIFSPFARWAIACLALAAPAAVAGPRPYTSAQGFDGLAEGGLDLAHNVFSLTPGNAFKLGIYPIGESRVELVLREQGGPERHDDKAGRRYQPYAGYAP
jgi:hypothetical protein